VPVTTREVDDCITLNTWPIGEAIKGLLLLSFFGFNRLTDLKIRPINYLVNVAQAHERLFPYSLLYRRFVATHQSHRSRIQALPCDHRLGAKNK
jgi:hypothetical protein